MALPSVKYNTEMLNPPNALLGLEYIRAGLTYYPSQNIYQSYAHQIITTRDITKDFPSGTALRKLITEMATGSNNCNKNSIYTFTDIDTTTSTNSNSTATATTLTKLNALNGKNKITTSVNRS